MLLHKAFGKVLFCATDIAAALLILHIVTRKLQRRLTTLSRHDTAIQQVTQDATRADLKNEESLAPKPWKSYSSVPAAAVALWLFNPYTATISTRGNADSIVSVMQLGMLALLQSPDKFSGGPQQLLTNTAAAGALYGLLVHWRLFPVFYVPCLALFLWERAHSSRGAGMYSILMQYVRSCLAFGMPALAVFFGLGGLFFSLYGNEFLYQTFTYHASRHDPRHNFSPTFLYTYLSRFSGESATHLPQWLDPSATALPCMLTAILAISFRFRRRLDLALVLTTMAFVAFNKVSTAQYFVWYFGLLPVLLPEMLQGWGCWHTAAGGAWLITQLAWLACAYKLEFEVCLRDFMNLFQINRPDKPVASMVDSRVPLSSTRFQVRNTSCAILRRVRWPAPCAAAAKAAGLGALAFGSHGSGANHAAGVARVCVKA